MLSKMFDNNTVYFGRERKDYVVCKSREEAELIKLLADLDIHGAVNVAPTPQGCAELSQRLRERILHATSRFEELASTRTSLEDKRAAVVDLLLRWFVLGRQAHSPRPQ